MKAYGFDDTDICRGELRAVVVDTSDLVYQEELTGELGWEYLSTRFAQAKKELLRRMADEEVEQESMDAVKSLKASDIPID